MTQEELLERWPKGPDGEPEQAVKLESQADFAAYSGIHCSILEAYGIPFLARRSGTGELGLLYGGWSTDGVELFVPASLLEEARQLLTAPAEDPAADEE